MDAIAIDGPGGAGKSTIAKLLANSLQYIYIDTGAMYRAVALYYLEKDVSLLNEDEIVKELDHIHIAIRHVDKVQHIYLNGRDVTNLIRTQTVSEGASQVAVILKVRQKLLKIQQEIAENANVVMDGRDIGTKVLPNAQIKIYLTASVEERVKRRMQERQQMGLISSYDEVKKEIEIRDERDLNRENDPLQRALDAHLIDCSFMTTTEVVEEILRIKAAQ